LNEAHGTDHTRDNLEYRNTGKFDIQGPKMGLALKTPVLSVSTSPSGGGFSPKWAMTQLWNTQDEVTYMIDQTS
jgi:hypothetical protein